MRGKSLRLRSVAKAFGRTEIIRGVDWEVAAGECHVLIGPNGAGKTTLFHLISGRLQPSAGRVELDGRDVTRLPIEERVRRGVGRSFQINNLFWRLTAAENVRCAVLARTGAWRGAFRFPDGAVEDETRALLAAVGLGDAAGVPAASLAYADQRALEIALALATRPAVLILDEPTAGMGRDDSARIVELVRRLKAEQTVILIEHDLDVVFGLADRISVLVAGRVLATGAPAAVRADPRVREAYLGRHSHA